MRKPFALLFLVAALAGCKTDCDSPTSVATIVSNGISSHWQCQNPTAVHAAVASVCQKLDLCTEVQSAQKVYGGPIAMVACPLIVNELRLLAASRVPADWQCNPDAIGVDFAAGLTALCELLPI